MSDFDPEKITFFAKTDTRGQQIPFGIKAKDRQRHMYVIGKTGMGKSTLLENMAAQDITNGEGLAFIDPHGSAIEVLLDYIPEDRLDDVVYFAPFDMENPVAFNIMEDVGIDSRHLVVSGLMSTFKKIWEDAWSARMEYILTNALLALIEYPDTTLLSVNRMLADKEYRDKVIENVKDPAVKAYWVDEFNNYTERFAAEALPAIQNKIGQFTGNPLIRNIIGQPKSSFDVRKMMDEKKILLINLSKGLVGETNADLIGSMLITKIYLAAMSRAELPPAQMKVMPNFYFYVDEFQSFANSTFANILSEARKYHLNLIIAHQYVAQMEEKIRDAVFGNVGTTVAFRTGPFDAEVLETVFAPQFEAADLVNLGFAQICLTLMIDGVGSQPFSAVTLPPVETPQTSHKHMAIKQSRQNYSRPRGEVEQAVIDSHSPDARLKTAEENGHGNKGGFTKPSGFFKVGTDKGFVKQKEQLKNGGSIKRGPAQTPPGTKSEQKTPDKTPDKKQSNDRQRPQADSKERRPKPPEKTADDLRAVLAGMTSGKKYEHNPDVNKSEIPLKKPEATQELKQSSAKRENQTKPSGEFAQTNNKPEHRERKFENRDSRPAIKSSEISKEHKAKADDLKSALAALGGKSTEPRQAEVKETENQPDRSQHDNQQKTQKKTEDRNTVQNNVIKNSNSRDRDRDRDRDRKIDKLSQKNHDNENNNAKINNFQTESFNRNEKKRKTASEQVPDQQAPEVKQSPHSQIGGARQPAFSYAEISEQPDLATVKQILRTSGKDRPPGLS